MIEIDEQDLQINLGYRDKRAKHIRVRLTLQGKKAEELLKGINFTDPRKEFRRRIYLEQSGNYATIGD